MAVTPSPLDVVLPSPRFFFDSNRIALNLRSSSSSLVDLLEKSDLVVKRSPENLTGMAAGKGGMLFEKVWRFVRTVYFMVVMVASLLILFLPVLVAIGDVLVPCVLISSFTCVRCYSFKEHLSRYSFRSSLTDIPVVSVFISSVMALCVTRAIPRNMCIFTVNSQLEAEASSSPSRRRLHLKKSWGMPVLFLSSVVFALGHIVIAYRASCRAGRKFMLHRIDPESVISSKLLFSSGYAKVPRSPTPTAGRTPKSDSEIKRKPFGLGRNDGELPVRLLADVDSLFMGWQGLTIHYKLSMPVHLHVRYHPTLPREAIDKCYAEEPI
ncbi:hypothetical protein OSB04_030482 [Centaurea solstitialis]|uniref:Uncharacterized protein n=1 Tax=Centaurea solstitialis TaxID=347529 RepID=A0AA38S710_9ASTR|nr:hypothetical protein OSB04_030482 [Centaurea solstitialis]